MVRAKRRETLFVMNSESTRRVRQVQVQECVHGGDGHLIEHEKARRRNHSHERRPPFCVMAGGDEPADLFLRLSSSSAAADRAMVSGKAFSFLV